MNRKSNPKKLSPQERATKNISALTRAYIYNQKTRRKVAAAALSKRPRPDSEVQAPMKTASYIFSYIGHGASLGIALPFIAFLLGLALIKTGYVSPPVMLVYFISIGILFAFEYAQSVTLDQVWDNYFNSGHFPKEAVIVAVFFSLFSVISSGASAYHYFGNSRFIFFAVGFACFNEMIIVYCNFYRHRYDSNAFDEVEFANDFIHNAEWNPLFPAMGTEYKNALVEDHKEPEKETTFLDLLNGRENVFIQNTTKRGTKKHDEGLNGHKVLNQSVQMAVPMVDVEEGAKNVPQAAEVVAPVVIGWSEQDIKKHFQRADYNVRTKGENYFRLAQLRYFTYVKDNFSSLQNGGFVPQETPEKRREWYDKNHPQEATKFKNLKASKK